ncbi:MAG: phosphatidylserine decarboxylase family protein [Bacteroidales bacterium]|nr:phosphatidylserine decarboxylase family protein [Bacteroidales bacterium]
MKNSMLVVAILAVVSMIFVYFPSFSQQNEKPAPYRVGEWLPSDQAGLNAWMKDLIAKAEKGDNELLPVVAEFKELIESDPEIYMYFHLMFDQVPHRQKFKNDPMGRPLIRDYHHMLKLINEVMTTAPEFNKTGLVGFPINAILDWPMGTPAGSAVFLNDKVNAQLKKILDEWAVFLGSEDSRYVLNDDPHSGWFGTDAQEAMPTFVEDFICDPGQPYHGFTSWDNFFTRQFCEGRRPVAAPGDHSVVANACESAPYRIAKNVKLHDRFWIKSQPYSLYHMMDGDPLVVQFEDGTIYQAFLSALSYHRWHSPVSGTIVKTRLIDGSYYAEALAEGFDPAGPNESQAYITEMATRGLVFIEADNPDIGLMCVMFVGMAEVSTCEIKVYEGQHVEKGDELGMFHFGGSTHCLIFRPGVNLEFDMHGQTPGLESENIPVRAKIARVIK